MFVYVCACLMGNMQEINNSETVGLTFGPFSVVRGPTLEHTQGHALFDCFFLRTGRGDLPKEHATTSRPKRLAAARKREYYRVRITNVVRTGFLRRVNLPHDIKLLFAQCYQTRRQALKDKYVHLSVFFVSS
jgi:hypothetical protein